jgi:hypothetical protein
MSSKAENRALITDKKPDTRKCGKGLHVALYEVHGLTEPEIEMLDKFMLQLTFKLDEFFRRTVQ